MEQSNRYDGRDIEPNCDVNVLLAPLPERAEDVDREDNPDEGDRDVDGPLKLGIFL